MYSWLTKIIWVWNLKINFTIILLQGCYCGCPSISLANTKVSESPLVEKLCKINTHNMVEGSFTHLTFTDYLNVKIKIKLCFIYVVKPPAKQTEVTNFVLFQSKGSVVQDKWVTFLYCCEFTIMHWVALV